MATDPRSAPAGRWLHPEDAEPEASARLFLLHHSGGAATAYRDWPALLPGDIACRAVQLPGRQERRHEPPYTRLAPLLRDLAETVAADLDERPYALFGHSMGGLLGYRLAVEMRRRGLPSPALLAVSGWAPDGLGTGAGGGTRGHPAPGAGSGPSATGPGGSGRQDPRAFMARLGSLPAEVAADRRLLDDTVRAMTADGSVCADDPGDRAAVDCPLVAYAGRHDPLVTPGAMGAWAERTPRYLGCRVFPGGHFFLHAHTAAITADLVQLLRRYAEPT